MKSGAPTECDVVVVGGGIVGLAVARELLRRHPDLELTVLEREPVVASQQTGHTSGVIHAGIYYAPGSLKAKLCVAGARELYAYCAEHGIEARTEGKLIVATTEEELSRLDELERRGRTNEVGGLRRVEAEEIAEIEPHARGLAALHSPETGVVDLVAAARAFAADVEAAGAEIATDCGVEGLEASESGIVVRHSQGETRARFVVACAGGRSARLAAE
ncbi:MAG: FAD-dependent oxidoreductase, partial [Solirubrobacterales bacterium]